LISSKWISHTHCRRDYTKQSVNCWENWNIWGKTLFFRKSLTNVITLDCIELTLPRAGWFYHMIMYKIKLNGSRKKKSIFIMFRICVTVQYTPRLFILLFASFVSIQCFSIAFGDRIVFLHNHDNRKKTYRNMLILTMLCPSMHTLQVD
jgi:hypothetical protein